MSRVQLLCSNTHSTSLVAALVWYCSYSTPSPPDVCDFCNTVINTALYGTTYKYVLPVQCVVIHGGRYTCPQMYCVWIQLYSYTIGNMKTMHCYYLGGTGRFWFISNYLYTIILGTVQKGEIWLGTWRGGGGEWGGLGVRETFRACFPYLSYGVLVTTQHKPQTQP